MIAMQPIIVARLSATGQAPLRVGNKHALSAPFGVFRAADGEFVIAVLNEKLFATLAATIGRADIASDAALCKRCGTSDARDRIAGHDRSLVVRSESSLTLLQR